MSCCGPPHRVAVFNRELVEVFVDRDLRNFGDTGFYRPAEDISNPPALLYRRIDVSEHLSLIHI